MGSPGTEGVRKLPGKRIAVGCRVEVVSREGTCCCSARGVRVQHLGFGQGPCLPLAPLGGDQKPYRWPWWGMKGSVQQHLLRNIWSFAEEGKYKETSERNGENSSSPGLLVAARGAGGHWAVDSAEAGVAAPSTDRQQLLAGEF